MNAEVKTLHVSNILKRITRSPHIAARKAYGLDYFIKFEDRATPLLIALPEQFQYLQSNIATQLTTLSFSAASR